MHDYANFASPLPHPGEILREDFMVPLGLTAGALARAMGLKDRTRVERLSRERQPITADTALRLGKVFNTTPQFWINMQTGHDLSVAAIAARDEIAALAPMDISVAAAAAQNAENLGNAIFEATQEAPTKRIGKARSARVTAKSAEPKPSAPFAIQLGPPKTAPGSRLKKR